MNSSVLTSRLDRLGAGVSFACAIHCAIMPFVIALMPFIGYTFLADERLENIIVGLSVALAAATSGQASALTANAASWSYLERLSS